MNIPQLQEALNFVQKRWSKIKPQWGAILGSGWGEVVKAFEVSDTILYDQIPGLGATGVEGHAGVLALGKSAGIETIIFQGRRHWYEGVGWERIALPIFILKNLGAKAVLITNAAGGIADGLTPGDLMAITDHINMMGNNPLVGPHNSFWGPRFPDLSQVYDLEFRELLLQAGEKIGFRMAQGIYAAQSGPAYETPAEIQMMKKLGVDAVGMSTVPEAILAHAAGMRVVGLSCITNFAAGISKHPLSHHEVTDTMTKMMPRIREVIAQFWAELGKKGSM